MSKMLTEHLSWNVELREYKVTQKSVFQQFLVQIFKAILEIKSILKIYNTTRYERWDIF